MFSMVAKLQELYNQMLVILGSPPTDGYVHPLPNCSFGSLGTYYSVHSPKLLVVDQEEIGLSRLDFHNYISPAGTGSERGKVIVVAKRPVDGGTLLKDSVIVVEGVTRSSTRSFTLHQDGWEQIDERYMGWNVMPNQGNKTIVWSHTSTHRNVPEGMWERVSEALERGPLCASEPYTKYPFPLTEPLRIRYKQKSG